MTLEAQAEAPQDQRSGVRGRILTHAISYVETHGLGAFRLRAFAESIGTSHRMVIHYFRSKDRLLAEVFSELRRKEIDTIGRASNSVHAAAQAMFHHYTAAENELRVTMFFDLFATAIQQPADYDDFLASLAEWEDLLRNLAVDEGYGQSEATVRASALVAGFRGVLIQLYAHDDRPACRRTFRLLLDSVFPVAQAKKVGGRGQMKGVRRG